MSALPLSPTFGRRRGTRGGRLKKIQKPQRAQNRILNPKTVLLWALAVENKKIVDSFMVLRMIQNVPEQGGARAGGVNLPRDST